MIMTIISTYCLAGKHVGWVSMTLAGIISGLIPFVLFAYLSFGMPRPVTMAYFINQDQELQVYGIVGIPEKEMELSRLERLFLLNEKYYVLLLEKKAQYSISKEGFTTNWKGMENSLPNNAIIMNNSLS